MAVLFIRDKHMSASDVDEYTILLQASLNDTDQILEFRCEVSYPDLVIQTVDFDFPRYPDRLCLAAMENVRKLVGLQIAPGYNHKVKSALGGSRGCVHMVDLAIEIGHVAVQAKLKRLARESARLSDEEKKKFWADELQGQCIRYSS